MYRRNWCLQQDNDPKHTSRIAKNFITENSICIIDWPSNSLDLNPIENMWTIIKDNVEKRMPQNISELTKFMVEEWDAIAQLTVNNLVMSMKTRCEMVLEKNSDRILY
ncbi:19158_t:CDS:1 [Funneliformis geosporum]|uniref:19158_t:CDS:1 n=1 Tax=Funneliformis geosporum TaxID=1117311 RepID=A0A9W4T0Q9_9GLOM|nr:19158_t:CDS:1 [Funneliformis geosporum]